MTTTEMSRLSRTEGWRDPHAKLRRDFPVCDFPDDATTPSVYFGADAEPESDKGPLLYPAAVSHFVSDLEKSVAFYAEALDARKVAERKSETSNAAVFDFSPHGVDATVQINLMQFV